MERGTDLQMRKRIITTLFSVILALVLCVGFTACGGSDEEQAAEKEQATTEQKEEIDPEEKATMEEKEEAMIEAEENAEETPVKTDTKYEDFVGSWRTITDMADDSFGGFQITFHENKKFDAVITGEEEKGECTFENGIVTAQNEVVNAQFWFNDEGILVVRDENEAMAMLQKVK